MAARALTLALILASSTAHGGRPIVGGAVDTGDAAVVAIAHRPVACGDAPVAFCSGVLVAPRVVLTAAHCLQGLDARGLEVTIGDTAAAAQAAFVVQSAQTYAGYDATTGDGDIAALLLAEPAQVTPIAASMSSIADVTTGAALRVVGFGVTSFTANDPGTKREATMMLDAVRAASFDATPSPGLSCAADSGGPVFATVNASEQLVGLTSRGDAGCMTNAVNARIDVAQASFIEPFVTQAANAPAGWPSSATSLGAACTEDVDCPALMQCANQRCAFPWLGAGSFGGTCVSDGGCAPMERCARVWPSGSDACHCFASSNAPPGGDGFFDKPPDGGCGCASTGGTSAWLLAAMIALVLRRRR